MDEQNVVSEPVVAAPVAPVSKPKNLGIGHGKKICPNCQHVNGAKAHVCPNCQHVFVIKALQPKVAKVRVAKATKAPKPAKPKTEKKTKKSKK